MGCLIGYARVSTSDQDIRLQLDALRDAGCLDEQVFLDTASGARTVRPGLDACLQALGPGDTLVIWRLDRLGRSMAHLVTLIEDLRQRQVGFRSLGDGAIDTTTASGELVFNIFSAWLSSSDGSFRRGPRRDWLLLARAVEKGDAGLCAPIIRGCGWRVRCMLTRV